MPEIRREPPQLQPDAHVEEKLAVLRAVLERDMDRMRELIASLGDPVLRELGEQVAWIGNEANRVLWKREMGSRRPDTGG